ncbi:HNH endonuclease [[Mycobacterium] crassicus]|uniref:HNH endonuclease n=1 Tax=[Mycobacterium] crassicus TaxID=2872309 RepID=A0ABU5XHC8_9MYCO|nr:HNH endonuclease [Mycolicibacter sp. MYC098]MEB3021288.1 HNH endonuclease [Mycolicibacter sp. MYC098]
MAVSKRLRFEVLRRDNHACRYCGRSAPDVELTVDHVVPTTLGGSDEPTNLVAACRDCNGGKSSVPSVAAVVADVAQDAVRWAAAMCQAADEMAAEEDVTRGILDAVEEAWNRPWIPAGWELSVSTFVRAGLNRTTLVDLARSASTARGIDDRWAYFCGCCWKRIRQLQDRAQELVSAHTDSRPGTALSTVWTQEEVDEYVSKNEWYGSRYLSQESIDSAFCKHRDWHEGDCGDPVCRIIRASWIGTSGDEVNVANERKSRRENAIMDEAEAALDG